MCVCVCVCVFTEIILMYIIVAATLFVGNLSFEVDEDRLTNYFSSSGHNPSSVRIITSQGRSKG